MNTKMMIIGAQLENITEELERRERILRVWKKKGDTATKRNWPTIKALQKQVEELKEQKDQLENQLTEIAVLDTTVTKTDKLKNTTIGAKRIRA